MKTILAFLFISGISLAASADCIQDCLNRGHDYNFCEFACRSSVFHPALKLKASAEIQHCETYEPECREEAGEDEDDAGGGPWGGL